MTVETLAVELLVEELPPKALKQLGEAFARSLASRLQELDFLEKNSTVVTYATPRRLAVSIARVRSVAPDAEVVEKLMPAKVARENLEALRKRLTPLGRAHLATPTLDACDGPDQLYVASDGKADYVYLRRLAKGQSLTRGLQQALDDALERLPIPKVMSYGREGGYYNDVKFVRPAHRLLALHGSDVVNVTALSLDAGRTTQGHRFLGRREIDITNADAYAPTLEAEGKVIPSFEFRRDRIATALQTHSSGATIVTSDALLDEVTALVEWPAVYAGTLDAAFLALPQECLILTMQQNQKYFPLFDQHGKLLNQFLMVSNMRLNDPKNIVEGNQRVIRPRLADARFFYQQDKKLRLADRVAQLSHVVYHNKLGSQYPYSAKPSPLPASVDARGCNSRSHYVGNQLTDVSDQLAYQQDGPDVI